MDYIGNPASAGVDTWEFHGYWDKDDEMTTTSTYFTCVADATAATVSTDTTTDNAPPVVVAPVPDSTIAPCNFLTGEGEGCAERRTEAQGPDPDACVIKGNVSFETGERIYHVPGQAYYGETVINESYGERWFCTEEEAVAAGWRKSNL